MTLFFYWETAIFIQLVHLQQIWCVVDVQRRLPLTVDLHLSKLFAFMQQIYIMPVFKPFTYSGFVYTIQDQLTQGVRQSYIYIFSFPPDIWLYKRMPSSFKWHLLNEKYLIKCYITNVRNPIHGGIGLHQISTNSPFLSFILEGNGDWLQFSLQ